MTKQKLPAVKWPKLLHEVSLVYTGEYAPQASVVRGPGDVGAILAALPLSGGARFVDQPREHFVALLLDGRHRVLTDSVVEVSVGTATSSLVHPREVFRLAIWTGAVAIVLAHNHPSGDPTPSDEDRDLTKRLVDAGEILGVGVLDHVIVAAGGTHSMCDRGEMGRKS